MRSTWPSSHPRTRVRSALAGLTLILAAASPAAAGAGAGETEPPPRPGVAELRAEIDALRGEYEARLADLERRLAALEETASSAGLDAPPAEAPVVDDDELAALRAEATAAVSGNSETPEAALSAPDTGAVAGKERSLSLLNPEISATGVLVARAASDAREELEAQEFELDVQSALDPYSRMRLTLAFGGEDVEVEEGWIGYSALPGGLELLAGRFRQRFGALNRQHLHALPQADYPLPLRRFFGDEGLAQTGLSLTWLPPHSWADAAELTFELTDGDSEAFGGESFERLSLLGRVKSFWEPTGATYVDWGLSAAAGEGPDGGDRRIWGTDLTWHWQPPSRASYRELTWRGELLRSERDLPGGGTAEAWGGYTYFEGKVGQRLSLGLRLDGVEDPDDPSLRSWGVVPYATWWQSEYVRLRAELRRLDDEASGLVDDQLLLQLVWAAGPHKHETY